MDNARLLTASASCSFILGGLAGLSIIILSLVGNGNYTVSLLFAFSILFLTLGCHSAEHRERRKSAGK